MKCPYCIVACRRLLVFTRRRSGKFGRQIGQVTVALHPPPRSIKLLVVQDDIIKWCKIIWWDNRDDTLGRRLNFERWPLLLLLHLYVILFEYVHVPHASILQIMPVTRVVCKRMVVNRLSRNNFVFVHRRMGRGRTTLLVFVSNYV